MEWINVISNRDARVSKININNLNEINDIKHFIFYDSWNNRVILEILAEITEYI